MAVSCKAYGSFALAAGRGYLADLDASVKLKCALSTVAPVQTTDNFFNDVTEIVDASYAAGGTTLTTVAVTQAGTTIKLTADSVTFAALNKNFRYAIIYDSTEALAANQPLIAYVDYGATLDVETLGPQDVVIDWPAGGILNHTVA